VRTSDVVDAMVVDVPLARHRDEPNRMHDEGPCNCSAMSTRSALRRQTHVLLWFRGALRWISTAWGVGTTGTVPGHFS
jgi:hypothetical protein